MAYKTLLAFHPGEEDATSLEPVLELAAASGAHVDVIVAGTLLSPPVAMYDFGPATEWVEQNRNVVEMAKAREQEISDLAGKKGVSATVSTECDYPNRQEAIAERYAFCADVHVATRKLLESSDSMQRSFNGTLFGAGCPFLLLPDGETEAGFSRMSRIAIAWNGRAEAAHAVSRALPLLKKADRVNIVVIDPQQIEVGEDPGSDLAAYLSRHGIPITVDVLASGGMEVAEKLAQRMKDIDADLLVMGGYGHTRLREWLLGGATRSILETAEFPVFMAH